MRRYLSITGVMGWTSIALIPALLCQIMLWGWGPLINLIVAAIIALLVETLCLRLRKLPNSNNILDGSALLSAVILALCLPPQLPVLLVCFGSAFMMIFGKHIYGGVGSNPFNPAMLAYITLLLSFPLEMTQWLQPNVWQGLSSWDLVLDKLSLAPTAFSQEVVDVYSSATALDSSRLSSDFSSWYAAWDKSQFMPYIILTSVYASGGLFILLMRIITWHIPLSFIAGLVLPAALFSYFSDAYAPAWFHLISGGAVFGAFFVATDPVSGATNRVSQLAFGFGIGLLTFIIRTWGGYADAVAFAVLFFNFVAPFMDKYLRPRVYGT